MTEIEKEALYAIFQLLPLSEVDSQLLKTFNCEINSDLTNFIHKTARDYETRQIARTFVLVNSAENEVVGYFTLSMKSLSTIGMSKTSIKKIDGVSNSRVCIHSFLIGQLGISDNYAQDKLGILLLDDAVNNEKVIKFYTDYGFSLLATNIDESENSSMRMIYKI